MGHRALVAYEGTDGRYSLHYSHWGGAGFELARDITPETPFGGEETDDGWARQLLDHLLAGEFEQLGGHLAAADRPRTAVDPEPMARDRTLAGVAAAVDPVEHEALYVVTPEFVVVTYLPLRLQEERALVSLRDAERMDAERVRAAVAGMEAVVDCLVEDGTCSAGDARVYLERGLKRWAGDREVVLPDA